MVWMTQDDKESKGRCFEREYCGRGVREAREECGLESKNQGSNGEEVGLVKCGLPVGEPVYAETFVA